MCEFFGDKAAFAIEYLALQLEEKGMTQEAKTFRDWSMCDDGMFAQAWVAAIATRRA